jgi:hypothetical protein
MSIINCLFVGFGFIWKHFYAISYHIHYIIYMHMNFLNFKQKTYRNPFLKLTRPKVGSRPTGWRLLAYIMLMNDDLVEPANLFAQSRHVLISLSYLQAYCCVTVSIRKFFFFFFLFNMSKVIFHPFI